MSILKDILKDEKERLSILQVQLENQIAVLAKGSLSKKKRGEHWYFYLAYREGARVIFKYVGKENSLQVNSLNEEIRKRKKLELKLQNIKNDLKDIVRGLGERQ
ncbi:MAG: hypothetical protein Q7J16_06670 [Candidatus Cloacimonadales bacterium]|nr:hypothetical protein [Candidatus Cloacimonadales bacterium]